MSWNGGKKGDAPFALVGKGVVFDTGGISIKPAAGMEDMTMDMGGAGVVAGVMRTLALRKAKRMSWVLSDWSRICRLVMRCVPVMSSNP